MKTNNSNVELVLRVRKIKMQWSGKYMINQLIEINSKHVKLPTVLYNSGDYNNFVGVQNNKLEPVEIYINAMNAMLAYNHAINRHEYAFEGRFEYDFNAVKTAWDVMGDLKPYKDDVTHAIVAWFEVMEATK